MVKSNSTDLGLADVIIINYNSSVPLAACLESIDKDHTRKTVSIFVFDNGSRERLDAIVARFPEIVFYHNPDNIGFARAVNRVLKRTHSRYVVILNPDTVIQEGFFQSVISHMDFNPRVGILGPKILNPDGSVQGSARSFPTLLTSFFGRTSLLTKLFPDNPLSCKNLLTGRSDGVSPMPVDWVSGACMIVRRTAIEAIGLMDERFFIYWEDADWCRRMWDNGWQVIYYPSVAVFHQVGQSSRTRPFRSELDFHVSAYRLFSKHSRGIYALFKPLVALALGIRCLVRSSVTAFLDRKSR
jgi:GT2 family glycosyltransferase